MAVEDVDDERALGVVCPTPFKWCLRFAGEPIFWMGMDEWWDFPEWLRGERTLLGALPPWTFAEARDLAVHGGAATWRAAAVETAKRAFGGDLLMPGRCWLLGCTDVGQPGASVNDWPGPPVTGLWPPPPRPTGLKRVAEWQAVWQEQRWGPDGCVPGELLPTRKPSAPDDGRLKAWRKAAKEGITVPALLLYLPVIEKYVVLDGHDRLHAALLERVPAPALAIVPIWEAPDAKSGEEEEAALALPYLSTEGANELVRRVAGERIPFPIAWARQYPGGPEAWVRDVRARLGTLGARDADLQRLTTFGERG